MTARTRKPASPVEHEALAAWRQARPATAMTALADAGYDQAAREEFLRTVVRLAQSDAADFSAESYVMPAGDDHAAYDCPCCGDVTMAGDGGGRPPCDDCQAAGCEPNRDGGYDDCQRPCPGCGDPRTADYYLHVTWARADGEVTYSHGYVCEEHLPSEAGTPGTPGAFIPSGARVIEYDAREL